MHFFQENAFENVICKMVPISSQSQWIKLLSMSHSLGLVAQKLSLACLYSYMFPYLWTRIYQQNQNQP